MSLLLEALKRAEDKGRRRQAGAGSDPAGGLPQDRTGLGSAPLPTLDLHGPGEPELEVELTVAPPAEETAAAAWEPQLALASAPAPLAPSEVPVPPPGATPVPPAPSVQPAAPQPRPARPVAADARSAERLLNAQQRPAPSRGRQAWLLAAVTLVGAGVAALWLWPEEPAPVRRTQSLGPVSSPPPAAPASAPVAAAAPVLVPAAVPVVTAASAPSNPASAMAPPPAPAVPAVAALSPATGTLTGTVSVAAAPPPPPPARAVPAAEAGPVPPAAEARPQRPRPEPAVQPARSTVGAARRSASPPAAAEPAPAPAEPSARQNAAAQVQRQLQQAYVDFQAGRAREARQAWREVVRADPTQRDAWLGLAIDAHRQGEREAAVAAYRQVLRLDPENGEAIGALATLDPSASGMASESRLREALARNPGNALLNSALARQLSGQGRWDEAQPFWFAAHAAAPEQPTHAYNLAVALDRLRKTTLAAQYYRKALELQQGQAPTFDAAAARARLQALEAGGGSTTP